MQEQVKIWGIRAALVVAALVLLLLLFLAFCFYTPPGHRFVAGAVEKLSGGQVSIAGLKGALPDRVQAERVVLRDAKGTWLIVEGASLDWHVFPAITGHVSISQFSARQVTVLRRRVASTTSSSSSTKIDIGALAIGRIVLAKPVLGHAAVLTARGALHYVSRHDLSADLKIARLDGAGRYDVKAEVVDDILRGTISVREEGQGIAGGMLGLPDLGPVALDVQANAQGNANRVRFKLAADLLDIFGGGTLDLRAEQIGLDFSAVAPAMTPAPYLSWRLVSAKGHIHGAFTAPDIDSDIMITGLEARGTRIAQAIAKLHGANGKVTATLTADGVVLPGETSGVFSSAPLEIKAEVDLNAVGRPLHIHLLHPLLQVAGRARLAAPLEADVTAKIPSLEALSPLMGTALDGNAAMALHVERRGTVNQVKAEATIATRGESQIAGLLGTAKLDGTAAIGSAGDLSLRASIKGAALRVEIAGTARNGKQSFTGEAAISDLSRLAPTLIGTLSARGSLIGPQGNAKLSVQGTASAATKGMARQQVAFSAEASGLPRLTTAALRASGRFDGAAVTVKADAASGPNGEMKISINQASWRSARAQGRITIAKNSPQGQIRLSVAQLADLSTLTGTALAGSVDIRTEFSANQAVVHASAADIAAGETQIKRIDLAGTIADPFKKPVLALTMTVPELATADISGSASVRVSGPLTAISANLQTELKTSSGQAFTIGADALADTAGKHISINRFESVWRNQKVTLAEPAMIDYANGLVFKARFTEGKAAEVSVAGSIAKTLNVRATANADLAVIASGLASTGQQLRGRFAGDVTVTGTVAKPNVVGQVTLANGEFRDYTQGLNLTGIEAVAEAQGSQIRLTKFTAKAGPGSITGAGTIDVAASGLPVDLSFKASGARPLTSDLLTARLDSELKLEGRLTERLRLSGNIGVRNASINLPEKMPSEVATLNVHRSRDVQPKPAPQRPARISLDLTITSSGQIFVRGRGLEAEFEGDLKIGGRSSSPQVSGGLNMRRGTMTLGSATLTFQSGKISFNGQALRRRLDPSLDLVAQTEGNGITATLKITGTASRPKIELSSTPTLPQDEILAQLLFQKSVKSLSALELAGVAQAAATLSGGGGFDPVGTVRQSLGLDRLAVGSDSNSSGIGSTSVEAGKYVLRNVYVAAKQDMAGGTRAIVQVDIIRNLKAQAQMSTGPRAASTASTPLHDNGDSIGLSYQFEY